MIINLSQQHSLVSNWMSELRDEEIQKDRQRFRRNLERIGEVAAYEISKKLAFVEKEVETPLGSATCKIIKEQPVLATILRAGIPLHNGLLRRIMLLFLLIANTRKMAALKSAWIMFHVLS